MADLIGKVKRKTRRTLNQRHSYDYPETAQGWKKVGNGPLISGQNGSVFDPFVSRVGSRYCMCLSHRASGSLVMYDSDDGVRWENPRAILTGASRSVWEKKVNRASFVVRNGKWYLWYTGQNSSGSAIGLAVSEDGINFRRVSDHPVLTPELAVEAGSVMNPCVICDEKSGRFRMWYAAGETYEPDVIMYAESEDGIHWKKHPKPVMKADPSAAYQRYKVGACDVAVLPDGTLLMAYIAYQNLDVARICVAASEDGIRWKLSAANPVISPGKGRWDSDAVYKPAIEVCEDDKIRIWYNGRQKTTESIGLAEGRYSVL